MNPTNVYTVSTTKIVVHKFGSLDIITTFVYV